MLKNFVVSIFLFLASLNSFAGEIKRISSIIMDLGRVEPIYMAPGLGTQIRIPEAISEVFIGSPKSFLIQYSKVYPNEVHIVPLISEKFATHLILNSGKKSYTFDLISSSAKNNQSIVNIVSSYGGPEYTKQLAGKEK